MSKTREVPTKIKQNPRFVAMQLLTQVEQSQAYSNLLVDKGIRVGDLESRDARLMTEIVYGTISHKLTLEYYLAPFTRKSKKLDLWVKELLLLSLYQLEYLDRVPEHAVVNDAVEIAKAYGNPGIGKFVNGVLRTVQREGLPETSAIKNPLKRLAIETSLPEWLAQKSIDILGMEETAELGWSLFEPSRVSARVNLKKMNREEAITRLRAEGYEVEPSTVARDGIVGKSGFLAGSQVFKTGGITMQDESSMLVAPSLQLKPSDKVLDACAAPGGKTTHIAQYLDAKVGGEVVALDIHPHKIKLIEDNAKRQEVSEVVVTKQLDARLVENEYPDESFDAILVDAPCSGLGLLRRKPDIKYSKNSQAFANLPAIQLAILESVSQKVKVCGIITYSTCTILPEENEKVVQAFLNKHPEFEVVAVEGAPAGTQAEYGVTLYPHAYQTDGFFLCSMRRRK